MRRIESLRRMHVSLVEIFLSMYTQNTTVFATVSREAMRDDAMLFFVLVVVIFAHS
jgi:hypothetical protein